MSFVSVFLIAVSLSLDALAVSVTCGMRLGHRMISKYLKISLFFGGFQAGMPVIGWCLGYFVEEAVKNYAGYLTCVIFLILGIKTIVDALKKQPLSEEAKFCTCHGFKCLTGFAVATSIDALLIGVVLAVKEVPLVSAISIIGITTFVISLLGCFLGQKVANILGKKANLLAGVILIILAISSV